MNPIFIQAAEFIVEKLQNLSWEDVKPEKFYLTLSPIKPNFTISNLEPDEEFRELDKTQLIELISKTLIHCNHFYECKDNQEIEFLINWEEWVDYDFWTNHDTFFDLYFAYD
jgi:CRISPR/Cas system endoribonuclease Cas6 (RAMP superfamily)